MEIRPLNVADDREVLAWWAVLGASRAFDVPQAGPLPSPAVQLSLMRTPEPGLVEQDWVALEGGDVIGSCSVTVDESAPDAAHVHVAVRPEERGRGIGRELADFAESQTNRPTLTCWVGLAEKSLDHRNVRFAQARGYALDSWEVTRRLPWPMPAEQLAALAPATPGYDIVTVTDDVPDAWEEGYRRLRGLVAADAPTGSVEHVPHPMTPDELRAERAGEAASGTVRFLGLALQDGAPVGMAELRAEGGGHPAGGNIAVVDQAHRGHRLGLACKVAALRALAESALDVPYVATRNDETNRWMIAVNEQIGYKMSNVGAMLVRRR